MVMLRVHTFGASFKEAKLCGCTFVCLFPYKKQTTWLNQLKVLAFIYLNPFIAGTATWRFEVLHQENHWLFSSVIPHSNAIATRS